MHDERLPGLLCEQCDRRAFARICWPGQKWRRACAFHCLLAVNLAAALRFPLCAVPLLVPIGDSPE
jgi:hypothetical protein